MPGRVQGMGRSQPPWPRTPAGCGVAPCNGAAAGGCIAHGPTARHGRATPSRGRHGAASVAGGAERAPPSSMDVPAPTLALAVLAFAAGSVALARDGDLSRRAAALAIVVPAAACIIVALVGPLWT